MSNFKLNLGNSGRVSSFKNCLYQERRMLENDQAFSIDADRKTFRSGMSRHHFHKRPHQGQKHCFFVPNQIISNAFCVFRHILGGPR